jgi:putative lipoprotein
MLSGMAEFVIFGFMPLMVGVLAGRGRPEGTASTITGSIAIPPCDPLPDNALVAIELVEQRRGETVLPVVAHETMQWRGGVQRFSLTFERTSIDPMAFYALRARIFTGGTVLFETRHPTLLAPLSGDKVTLMLMPPT